MTNTFSIPNDRQFKDSKVCHSYIKNKTDLKTYDSDALDNLIGSGSVYSTVDDLFLYDQAL